MNFFIVKDLLAVFVGILKDVGHDADIIFIDWLVVLQIQIDSPWGHFGLRLDEFLVRVADHFSRLSQVLLVFAPIHQIIGSHGFHYFVFYLANISREVSSLLVHVRWLDNGFLSESALARAVLFDQASILLHCSHSLSLVCEVQILDEGHQVPVVHVDGDLIPRFVVEINLQIDEDAHTFAEAFCSFDAFLSHQHSPLEGISHCEVYQFDEAMLSKLGELVRSCPDQLIHVVDNGYHVPELLLQHFQDVLDGVEGHARVLAVVVKG